MVPVVRAEATALRSRFDDCTKWRTLPVFPGVPGSPG
jgi:hypothetical protein